MAFNMSAQTVYLRNKIESSSPLGRIIILYESCLRFLRQSEQSMQKGEKIAFVHNVIKAQNIIRELRNSLNLEIDEKVALGFYQIYTYMLKQLMGAVRQKTTGPVKTVINQLEQLYISWKTAEEKGLGRDIKPVESRKSKAEGKMIRTIAGQNAASSLGEGLNLIS